MKVGVGRLILEEFNNTDLKHKRRNIENISKELKRKYNLSILEVGDKEDLEKTVLGFSLVMPENWQTKSAESLIQKICEEVDQLSSARLMLEDWDLIHALEE